MKKIWLRKFASLAAAAVLLAAADTAASQTGSALKDTGKKIDKLEDEKERAEEKVGNLQEEKNSLQGELSDLNSQLSEVSAQINDLEAQIQDKETEIQETALELSETEADRAEQYENMKLRIRFIYEKGETDLTAALLESRSLADFLNKAEYAAQINRYDRRMLKTYEETCQIIAEKKEKLQTEETELVAMQENMEQKKQEVEGLIAKTQEGIQAKQNEISDAQQTVEEYEAQIAKMKAYEAELERKKAEEAKKRAAEQKKAAAEQKKNEGAQQTAGGGGTVNATAGDLAMLAALVECEAGGESYEGQWAVASVVINRVRSGNFPNTVSGVIYQGGQFSPVASGRFAIVLAKGAQGSCVQAASAALSGSININALYFCRADSGVAGTVIGGHVFY